MEVRIIFKDATAEKVFKNADNVYTKGGLLVVREGDWLFKYPPDRDFQCGAQAWKSLGQ